MDKEYLASSWVQTPDPRQMHPPRGERLVIEWKLPHALLQQNPCLQLDVLYKNYTKQSLTFPVEYRRDYEVYTLLGEEFIEKKGILTYRARIFLSNGEVFRDWKHQLWTEFITEEEVDQVDAFLDSARSEDV